MSKLDRDGNETLLLFSFVLAFLFFFSSFLSFYRVRRRYLAASGQLLKRR